MELLELEGAHRRLNKEIASAIIERMAPGEGLEAVSEVFQRIASRCKICRQLRTEEKDDG